MLRSRILIAETTLRMIVLPFYDPRAFPRMLTILKPDDSLQGTPESSHFCLGVEHGNPLVFIREGCHVHPEDLMMSTGATGK